MALAQLLVMGAGAFVDGNTRYTGTIGTMLAQATESAVEMPTRQAGTASKLFVNVISNTVSASTPVTLRKSAAATTLTLNVGADQSGVFEDLTNSVTYAASDEMDVQVVPPAEAGTNTLTMGMVGVAFSATTNTATVLGCSNGTTVALASVTRYTRPAGFGANFAGELGVRIRAAFTARDLSIRIGANARTTTTTFKSRKNAADGGQSIAVGATQTGFFEDTSGTDTLVSDDDFNFAVTTGTGTETLTHQVWSCSLTSTESKWLIIGGSPHGGEDVPFNTTNYYALGGDLREGSTTEANHQLTSRFAYTARELNCYIATNSIATSASTLRFRRNGANGNQVVSISAAQTGLVSDTSGTDSVADGDLVNYSLVTPNTSGSLGFVQVALIGETAGGGAAFLARGNPLLVNQAVNRAATH